MWSVKSQVGSRKRKTDELIREADSAPKSLTSAMMMLVMVTVRSLTFLNFLLLPQKRMMPIRMLKCYHCTNSVAIILWISLPARTASGPGWQIVQKKLWSFHGQGTDIVNAVNRSPKMSDTVEEIAGTTFINPTATRWSSEFDAVQRVLSAGIHRESEILSSGTEARADVSYNC